MTHMVMAVETVTTDALAMLPKMTPMRLDQQAKPFDHPEWLFEVKFDGFRSLAYIEGQCELVSQGIT